MGAGELILHRREQRRAARRSAGRGLLVRHEPPVRLEHGDAAPRRAVDHGRRDGVRHRARHRAHGPHRSAAAAAAAPKTRVTEFNKRLSQIERRCSATWRRTTARTSRVPFPDYILDAPPITSMTQTAQNVAEVYGLSREEMDQFSVESHKKTAAAYEKGIYKDEIIPLEVEQPVFDDQGNWVRRRARQDRSSSSATSACAAARTWRRLGGSCKPVKRHPELRRQGAAHHRRQLAARRTTASPPRCS